MIESKIVDILIERKGTRLNHIGLNRNIKCAVTLAVTRGRENNVCETYAIEVDVKQPPQQHEHFKNV